MIDKCVICGYPYKDDSNCSHKCEVELLGEIDLLRDEFMRIKASAG